MPVGQQILWLVILSLVVASVSWTVTQEEVFRELREYCERRSQTCRTIAQRKFFYIFTCEYCFSHWVALAAILFTGYKLLIDDWRGYVLAFFLLPWIANQWMSLYRRLRVEIMREHQITEKLKDENEQNN